MSADMVAMQFPPLPRGKNSEDTLKRRKILEETLKLKFRHLTNNSLSAEAASKNIENFIGVSQVPLGVVGPLHVKGQNARGAYYIPMATTEGALLATVNRGCSVVTASGGATCRIIRDEMTRAPILRVDDIEHGIKVINWIGRNMEMLRRATAKTTSHGELVSAEPYLSGRNLFIRFSFATGDAMGMNMATIASQQMCEMIEKKTGAKTISVSGNMCTDKKAAAINYIGGRGKSVLADVNVPESVVVEKLHASSAEIAEAATRKNLVGSAMALSMGFNSHFANMAAALFIATGQDAAQVVEASMGMSIAESTDSGLYFSVRIPSLEVGTVGGGTGLPTQREALEIMGCSGSGKSPKFAEIAAALILAGELSTLAAQSRGELAAAHSSLAR